MKFTDLAHASAWQEFRDNGFLRISNVIDPQKVIELRTEAYRVFRDADAIKPEAYRQNDRSGFSPPGIESVSGKRSDYGRQFWDLRLTPEANEKVCVHSKGLVRLMRHLTLELSVIMFGVSYYMERHLGPHMAGLHKSMLKGEHGLRATHYPMVEKTDDEMLFPEHRDFSLVTIFIGGAEPGLQVESNGKWHDLENPLGDLVIMTGGMLRYWTGGPNFPGRIAGLRHRVRHLPSERLSLSFFTEPEHSTLLPNGDGKTVGEYINFFISATRKQI